METKAINSVIVAIDFSVYSKLVVKEAQTLAREMNLPIKYVHVFDYFQTLGDTIQQFEISARKKLIKTYKLSADADIVLRLGDPAQQIIDVAQQSGGQPLIVIGYKGYSRISRFFLGSTAEQIAAVSPFPVWVHRGRRTVIPKKVLVPSDFSLHSDSALSHVKHFEDKLKAQIELFHVIPQAIPILDFPGYAELNKNLQKEDDKIYESFKKRHPQISAVRSQGAILEKIGKRAKKFNLIALAPSEKSNIVPLLGRTTTKLLRSGDKPILICP